MENKTIAAIATPLGGALCVIRMSGENSLDIFKKVFSKKENFEHAKIYHGQINFEGEPIDDVTAVYYESPRSYTGENSVEIFAHGSPQGASLIIEALIKSGASAAQPGEFSKRAFLNGKTDLTSAEAVCDFISAQGKKSAKSAQLQLRGSLKEKINGMQSELSDILAEIEAGVEYPEEDLEIEIFASACPKLKDFKERIDALKDSYNSGRIIKEGLRIALAGDANVGKSSLMNVLCGSDRAIVTNIPGTTRDTIEQSISLDGINVILTDTAGIRQSDDIIEQMGIDRSKQALKQADITLLVVDGSEKLSSKQKEIFESIEGEKIVVINKQDKGLAFSKEQAEEFFGGGKIIYISAKEQTGIDILKKELLSAVNSNEGVLEGEIITGARHFGLLQECSRALGDAIYALEMGIDLDCVTIDISAAWNCLGEITGRNVSEEIIDRIFEKFCLGK